jgi:acyl-coenzyme A thioesterase PaaI-like protein
MPADAAVLTAEFKVNLLAPGKGEAIVARARVLKSGQTLSVVRGDVYALERGEERLVATMLATMMAVRDRGLSG